MRTTIFTMILIFGDTGLDVPFIIMVGLYFYHYWDDFFVFDEVDA